MTAEATGIKRNERLTSYYGTIEDYRVVGTADGAVNASAPPDVSLIDNRASGRGENNMFVYADPAGGDATLQVWIITAAGEWYFHSEQAIATGRPHCWLVEGLPAVRYAVVVTACGDSVTLRYAHTK
jgi:hypothetical protein